MLSIIRQPGIKVLCVGAMIVGNNFFKLLARTLEISLYKTLHKLMGLNSVTQVGCPFQ
jgi:hypothetical protein